MKKLLLLTTILFTFSLNISAKNTDAELNIAQQFYNAGNYTDGYEFLLVGFDENSTNALEYRLLGLLAKANGKLFSAKEYFNSAIKHSQTPELTGEMQLELAQVEYQLGNDEVAKNYLTKVRAMNPPKKVGDNIDNFLAAINSGNTPKNYSGSVSLGFISDSNVNAGPQTDSVLMFGLPFTLSDDAKASKDNAKTLKFNFNHQKLLSDDWTLQNSLSMSKTDYNSLDNLDSLSVSLSSGVSTKLNNKTVLSVPIIADWVKIGHDNSYYSYSYGVAPQLRYQINNRLALNNNFSISRKKYQASGKSDSRNRSLGVSLQYQINNVSYMGGGLSYGKSKSNVETETNKSNGVNLFYGYNFANKSSVNVSLNYNKTDYNGVEIAYNKSRDDKPKSINLNYSYPVAQNYTLNFGINQTKNDSNIEMYQYTRNQKSIALSYSF